MPWVLGPLFAPELLALLPELLVGAVFLALVLALAVWLEPIVASMEGRRTGGLLHIIDIPGHFIRSAAASAYHAVAHSISVAASHRMRPFAHWIHGVGTFALVSGAVVGTFAAEVAHGFERTTTVVIPREIGKATRPISRRAKAALGAALAAAAATKALRHWITHVLHHDVLPRLHRLTHAIDVAIPRELGRIRAREKALEREIEHPSTRWLRRIAGAMFATTLLGLMIRTLARRFPWLFCRKTKALGNRVCSLDNDLFGSLITDTLIIGGSISIVAFARELQALEGEAVGIIRGFIREA